MWISWDHNFFSKKINMGEFLEEIIWKFKCANYEASTSPRGVFGGTFLEIGNLLKMRG